MATDKIINDLKMASTPQRLDLQRVTDELARAYKEIMSRETKSMMGTRLVKAEDLMTPIATIYGQIIASSIKSALDVHVEDNEEDVVMSLVDMGMTITAMAIERSINVMMEKRMKE